MSMDTAKDDISLCSADAPSRLYSMCATLEITQDDIYDYMMKQKKNYRRGDQGEIGPRRKGRWGSETHGRGGGGTGRKMQGGVANR